MSDNDAAGQLKRLATRLEATYGNEAPDAAKQASASRRTAPWMSKHLGRVAAALLTVIIGAGSLAVAADASVPGQLLYPVDTSVESVLSVVGLSSPEQRLNERTQEAQTLLDSGQPAAAMQTLLAAVQTEFSQMTPDRAAEHVSSILGIAEQATTYEDSTPPDETLLGLVERVRDSVQPESESNARPSDQEGDTLLGVVHGNG